MAAAVRKRDGKARFGIKAKLFLAFGGMAMLTCGASAVAWYAFTDIDRSVARITTESIVGMTASLRLAEKSAEITATARGRGNDAPRALHARLNRVSVIAFIGLPWPT